MISVEENLVGFFLSLGVSKQKKRAAAARPFV